MKLIKSFQPGNLPGRPVSNNLKHLWAPWRMGYIRTPKNEFGPCLFCDKAKIGDDDENLVVHRGEHSYVLLNLYPYNNGHLMITPYEHEEHFDSLLSETQVEMMKLSSQSMTVLRESLNADGFNFGANFGEVAGAGVKEHVHLHIVPRWIGDTNFMPIMGHTKVMIDGLKETRKQLSDAFGEY